MNLIRRFVIDPINNAFYGVMNFFADNATCGVIVGFLIVMVILQFGLASLSTKAGAIRSLENQGYTNVQVTHKAWFMVGLRGCDEKDTARFDMKATTPGTNGVEVELSLCKGLFKNFTPRYK